MSSQHTESFYLETQKVDFPPGDNKVSHYFEGGGKRHNKRVWWRLETPLPVERFSPFGNVSQNNFFSEKAWLPFFSSAGFSSYSFYLLVTESWLHLTLSVVPRFHFLVEQFIFFFPVWARHMYISCNNLFHQLHDVYTEWTTPPRWLHVFLLMAALFHQM